MTEEREVSEEEMYAQTAEELAEEGQAEQPTEEADAQKEAQAEEPTEEAQSEEQTEDAQEDEKSEEDDKTVPLKALREARYEARQLEKQLREERDQMERRFEQLIERVEKKDAPAEEEKEWALDEEDPVGSLADGIKRSLDLQKQAQTQQEQRAQQERIQNYLSQDRQAVLSEAPDLTDAINHLEQSRIQQYEEAGIFSQQEIEQMILEEGQRVMNQAIQRGQSPHRAFYNLARAAGYQKPEPQSDNTEKMEKLDKGQNAAKSLSGGGQAKTRETSFVEAAKLSDAEFDKWFEKHWPNT